MDGIGHDDIYYGGTTYDNSQGLGVQLSTTTERGENPTLSFEAPFELEKPKGGLLAVPITRLYDHGTTIAASELLATRLESPQIVLNPEDAEKLGLEMGASAIVTLNGAGASLTTQIDNSLPKGIALIPRSLGLPIDSPTSVEVKAGA